ncbi:hypothetical protein DV738_g1596, partial [Chaetothyriales sp. CBS 135597]
MSHNADQPGIATNDAANMAKLRKSLKQCQRRALQEQQRASRLTPSEIRALNSTAASSGETPSRQGSAHAPRRHATPPDSPTDHHHHQARQSRTSSTYLPTPPQSPRPQHGSRPSSYVGHQPLHGYLSQPRPRERTRSDMGNTDRFSTQRWSTASASSVSLRSLPTYRGHEMTHAGSMNMLRRPSLDIVNNPLSMFSRPRQAIVNPAPDPRRSSPDLDPFEAQTMLDRLEAEEREAAGHEAEQPQLSRTVSPVSTEEAKTPEADRFSFVEIARGLEAASQEHVAESQIKSIGYPVVQAAQPPVSQPQQRQAEKKSRRRRFSFHSVFSDKESASAAVDKTSHRRTVAFIEQTEMITDPGDCRPDTVVSEKQASSPDSEMVTHLPSRPHSIASSDNFPERSSVPSNGHVNLFAPTTRKAKALTPLAIPKAPAAYGQQCKCCGKLKRPVTFSAELSPVPENENLRTNFGSDIERSRASLDAMTSKRYTPVIPMEELYDNAETVQAGGEQPVKRDVNDDIIMEMRQPRPKSWRGNDEARLVRFASLHGLNVEFGQDDDSDESNDEVEVVSTPVVEPIITPRGYQALPSTTGYNLLDTKDSLHMLSTASLETAEQVSMATLRTSKLIPRPAPSVEVNPRFTPTASDVTLDVTSEQQSSKPTTDSSLVDTRARSANEEDVFQYICSGRQQTTFLDVSGHTR